MASNLLSAHAARLNPLSLTPRPVAFALFVLTLALRIPFASQTLNHWDSVNHALALTSFNVPIDRPQPPGYILYIGMARLLNFIFPDPQTALVTLSILASGLAVAFIFLLGNNIASRKVGLIAALLLLTSPAFWFDGEVALPYVVEGCFSIVVALLFYRILSGETKLAPLAAVVFAIAIGARQWLVIYFAPLALYVFLKQSRRVRIESALWFAGVCLIWFIPLAATVGGIGNYIALMKTYNSAFSSELVISGTGGLTRLLRNVTLEAAYTAYAMNLALVPMLYAITRWLTTHFLSGLRTNLRVRFFVLWAVPSILFYTFVHMGSPGLIYVFLVALILVAAVGIEQLTRSAGLLRYAVVGVLCAANLFIFFLTPPDLYTGRDLRALNYSSLVAHDISLRARVDAIETNWKPDTTLIFADDWRFAEYYLPQYRVLSLSSNPLQQDTLAQNLQEVYTRPERIIQSLSNVQTVILFDAGAASKYNGVQSDCLPLPDTACLLFVRVPEGDELTIQDETLQLRAQ